MMTEHDWPFDDDQDYNDYGCEGCGRGEYDSGHCPLCCPSGSIAPGTEECDYCEYYDECLEDAYS